MTYTIETRAPGSADWKLAPFSITDLIHARAILRDLSEGLKCTEARLLEDGEVIAVVGRFGMGYPNPQNLPRVRTLVPSALPMWECAAVARRRHTADCALYLWRNGSGMWNASSLAHLQGYLQSSRVERLHSDAEDLQLLLATSTADKLQQVLVGYVDRREDPSIWVHP